MKSTHTQTHKKNAASQLKHDSFSPPSTMQSFFGRSAEWLVATHATEVKRTMAPLGCDDGPDSCTVAHPSTRHLACEKRWENGRWYIWKYGKKVEMRYLWWGWGEGIFATRNTRKIARHDTTRRSHFFFGSFFSWWKVNLKGKFNRGMVTSFNFLSVSFFVHGGQSFTEKKGWSWGRGIQGWRSQKRPRNSKPHICETDANTTDDLNIGHTHGRRGGDAKGAWEIARWKWRRETCIAYIYEIEWMNSDAWY